MLEKTCEGLELVEKKIINGITSFKFRIEGTHIYINVWAENVEEAVKIASSKAGRLVKC